MFSGNGNSKASPTDLLSDINPIQQENWSGGGGDWVPSLILTRSLPVGNASSELVRTRPQRVVVFQLEWGRVQGCAGRE